MISSIRGRVTGFFDGGAQIEVGLVGLQVFIPAPSRYLMIIVEYVSLSSYLAVREDSLTLYGFASEEERDTFILLLGVNGVGPRTALTVLSKISPVDLRRAIINEQVDLLSRVPGIGQKTAPKIILHLKDKLKKTSDSLPDVPGSFQSDIDIMNALVSLGYSVVEAQTAIQNIPKNIPQDLESRLRFVLQSLAH